MAPSRERTGYTNISPWLPLRCRDSNGLAANQFTPGWRASLLPCLPAVLAALQPVLRRNMIDSLSAVARIPMPLHSRANIHRSRTFRLPRLARTGYGCGLGTSCGGYAVARSVFESIVVPSRVVASTPMKLVVRPVSSDHFSGNLSSSVRDVLAGNQIVMQSFGQACESLLCIVLASWPVFVFDELADRVGLQA
jgi:hypothetical protein